MKRSIWCALLCLVVLSGTSIAHAGTTIRGTVTESTMPAAFIPVALVPLTDDKTPDMARAQYAMTDQSGSFALVVGDAAKYLVVSVRQNRVAWAVVDQNAPPITMHLAVPATPNHAATCTVSCCYTPLFWGLSWYCSWDTCGFSSCWIIFGTGGCRRC